MKLIDTKDWKAVHFKDRTILRVDVEPMKEPGHFKVVSQ